MVPERLLLLLRQPLQTMVPLAGRPQTVLTHAVQDTKDGQADGSNLASEVDAVAGGVSGCVCGDISPSVGWSVCAPISSQKRAMQTLTSRQYRR